MQIIWVPFTDMSTSSLHIVELQLTVQGTNNIWMSESWYVQCAFWLCLYNRQWHKPNVSCLWNNECTRDSRFYPARSFGGHKKLKSDLSSGPDGLPPLLYKRVKDSLAYPLALMFTQLFSVGIVPYEWKNAIVTPIFEKGLAGNVSNYLPVSLTCASSKLMERIISAAIYRHLLGNMLLSSTHHGFIKGKSTCTNLVEDVSDWTLAVQNRCGINVAYIYFSKAFDTVSYEKLFHCLYSYMVYVAIYCDGLKTFSQVVLNRPGSGWHCQNWSIY